VINDVFIDHIIFLINFSFFLNYVEIACGKKRLCYHNLSLSKMISNPGILLRMMDHFKDKTWNVENESHENNSKHCLLD